MRHEPDRSDIYLSSTIRTFSPPRKQHSELPLLGAPLVPTREGPDTRDRTHTYVQPTHLHRASRRSLPKNPPLSRHAARRVPGCRAHSARRARELDGSGEGRIRPSAAQLHTVHRTHRRAPCNVSPLLSLRATGPARDGQHLGRGRADGEGTERGGDGCV